MVIYHRNWSLIVPMSPGHAPCLYG